MCELVYEPRNYIKVHLKSLDNTCLKYAIYTRFYNKMFLYMHTSDSVIFVQTHFYDENRVKRIDAIILVNCMSLVMCF